MKTCFQTLCFALLFSMLVTDCFADSYRARGEVYYEDKNGKGSRSFRSEIDSKNPLILKGGEKIISIEIDVQPPPSVKYSLTVSLLTNPKSNNGFSTTIISSTFQSSLVGGEYGPLEFEAEQNGIKMGGVIGVSSKK